MAADRMKMICGGCCLGAEYDSEAERNKRKSYAIDKELAKEKREYRREVKLLLLGAGESGKSTFLKQMKIIHGIKFDPETIKEFQLIIYENILKGMRVLVDAREKLDIPWTEPKLDAHARNLLEQDPVRVRSPFTDITHYEHRHLDTKEFLAQAYIVKLLWQDAAIKMAYKRRREFQLNDSLSYYMSQLHRIAQNDWLPNNADILHARKATKGISETVIPINNIPFRFVDVGGQRSQRQKWFQCFESVTSILFLVSSSEFDQVLLEDRRTSRLEESQNVFDVVVNHRAFAKTSIILFLNKMDLLHTKIQDRTGPSIATYFDDFVGNPHDLSDVQAYILRLFLRVRHNPKKSIFHHFTTAIDTENIKIVFNAVKTTILQRNLETLMLH